MSNSPYIIEITENNYQKDVVERSYQVPVLVDFWASWCQPCQMLMPVLANLAEAYGGKFILAKVNTEEQQNLAAQFGIRSIPTVKGNAKVALDLLQEAKAGDPDNPNVDIALAQAHAAAGDTDSAMKILERLPLDAQDDAQVKTLKGLLFFENLLASAPAEEELEQRLEENSGDSEARYLLAAHKVVKQDYESALELLLELMRKDRNYGDDAARKAILRVFDLLGEDPLVHKYRSRMMNLLY